MWLTRFLRKAGTITFPYPEGLVGAGGGVGWLKGSLSRGVGRLGRRENGRGVGVRGLFHFKAIHSKNAPYSRLIERACVPKLLPEVVFWLPTRVAWVWMMWRTGPWDCFGSTKFARVSRNFRNDQIALYQIKIGYWQGFFWECCYYGPKESWHPPI